MVGGGIAGVLFLGFIFQVRLNSRLSKITANLEQISLSSGREMSHNLDHVKAMHQATWNMETVTKISFWNCLGLSLGKVLIVIGVRRISMLLTFSVN